MKKIKIDEVKTIVANDRIFYYDEKKALLFYVAKEDIVVDDYLVIEKGEILDSIGLSKENWEENPSYWAEKYNDQLDKRLE